MIVLLWVLSVTQLASAGLPVEISSLYNHGVIYERLADVRLELGKWSLHSFYDLSVIREEIDQIEKLSNILEINCNKLETSFGLV